MPIQNPSLDDRKYQQLLDEALARIPVHNPEWTNFNKSDPGVTLIEVFAFLTENLLYRANQIPERNRRKFLSLLGMPLQSATPARGLVTIANERGPLTTVTVNGGMEVRAGQIPFRTKSGLDVLPIETKIYYKHKVKAVSDQQRSYYRQLYASFFPDNPLDTTDLTLYETVPMPEPLPGSTGVDLGSKDVVDGLWIALLMRTSDVPKDKDKIEAAKALARKAIAGKTMSLGVVPYLPDAERLLNPVGQNSPTQSTRLVFEVPKGGLLPDDRKPNYRPLPSASNVDVLSTPGIVQVTFPEESGLSMWTNLDPLDLGVGDFPPALEDSALSDRLITWVHMTAPTGVIALVYWLGINAAEISQGAVVTNERLPDGSGEPDQSIKLSHIPVIPGSVALRITSSGGTVETWREIDDLISAGPEVPIHDLRLPPGVAQVILPPTDVFQLDAEAGMIRFGDGIHGKRPPQGASLRADYTYSVGAQGNMGIGSVKDAPALPAGFKVSNPVPTWGGADSEMQAEAEKQISRYLQHRDRLVNIADFETITHRTPGAAVGRVEVLPAYHPRYSEAPGDAPGMVTLVLVPRYDDEYPDSPEPDHNFLNAVCEYLDPRRLATTELFLTGPDYIPLWVSIGLNTLPGASIAEVREAVKSAVGRFLLPLPPVEGMPVDDTISNYASGPKGWPLGKPVVALELAAVASRVPGVMSVKGVLLIKEDGTSVNNIDMSGIELPRILGISVSVGDPLTAAQLGLADGPSGGSPTKTLPLPIIPEECK